MHFISNEFLIFSLGFFLTYFILAGAYQKYFLILSSIVFSAYYATFFLFVLLISITGNYLCALLMDKFPNREKMCLTSGILFNVGMLFIFKYFDFFTTNLVEIGRIFNVNYTLFTMQLAAPLGLSFYTFQAISFLVDLHRRILIRPSFIDFFIYMTFWPKFVAGPIIRARHFLPQLREPMKFNWPNFLIGTEMIVFGLFLKVVLADNLAPQVDKVYLAPQMYDGANSLLAVIFFTFQIYGDFAGYSLIVVGIARIMGFSVRANFRRPNFANSMSDFWSRWHISLSSWLEEYVFRPLSSWTLDSGQAWNSVADIYTEFLGKSCTIDDTFQTIGGDSLSFVQIHTALQEYLGIVPPNWNSISIGELQTLKATGAK